MSGRSGSSNVPQGMRLLASLGGGLWGSWASTASARNPQALARSDSACHLSLVSSLWSERFQVFITAKHASLLKDPEGPIADIGRGWMGPVAHGVGQHGSHAGGVPQV